MRIAWRVAPDEIPGAHGDGVVDKDQFAVGHISAHTGDTALAARRDDRARCRGIAVGEMRIQDYSDAHAALDRANQRPAIGRTHFVDGRVNAVARVTKKTHEDRSRSIGTESARQYRHGA